MKNPLIAERLKFYRKKNNLTIPQVSAILSEKQPVAEKTIYGWESGHTQPDSDTLLRLCCIYHMEDILEIFGYKPPKKNHFNLTTQEKDLIIEYRNHPDMQKPIQRLLEMEENE
ncbi:MAG: helix-turn-helix transcriptional regulator [Lachnospiraceae bacterium]|nr:helix-turn-helix transcriptional regulator [Lachnospiraceae bacterium]